MVLPSISTSPVEKLRWKFSISVAAFHRHHSSNEKSFSCFTSEDSFFRVSFCTSHHFFRGTKKSTEASTPFLRPVMRV